MKNIILNGELYLQKKPTIETKYQLQVPQFYIEDSQSNQGVDINNEKDLQKLSPYIIEFLEQIGVITKELVDNTGFYHIYTDGNNIFMIQTETGRKILFNTYESLLQYFISLEDFLNQGVYIGRKLNGPNNNVELLYEFSGIWLIKYQDQYTVITKDQVLEYYQIGEILPYYEKNALYQDIIKNSIHKKSNGESRI